MGVLAVSFVAGTACGPAAETQPRPAVPATVSVPAGLPGPLHTAGRWIVGRSGRRVKLVGVNWSGAETQAFTVGGLDARPLDDLAALIAAGGFNSVRLPWSNQLVEENPVVPARYLAANPQLQGKRALEVLDAVVAALGRRGLMVVLDNHRSRADWCCDEAHGDGLWYTPQYPESAWIADWQVMAVRYRSAGNVVGAELRNEIRTEPQLAPGPTTASWGDGNRLTDWRAAAERAGNAVLAVAPDLLVIVGGLDYAANLTGAYLHPVRLSVPARLVYAAHDYRWMHTPAQLGNDRLFGLQLGLRFGYLAIEGLPFTAPVYLSETGTCTQPTSPAPCDPADPAYMTQIGHYLTATDLDVAYWPLNGTQGPGYGRAEGAPDTYGLLAPDWSGYGNQAVLSVLLQLQRPARGPGTGH